MEAVMAICAGLALAAACGFRIFVPLFIASLAVNVGVEVPLLNNTAFMSLLGMDFKWFGNDLVTGVLGVATFFEIGAYYIPWLDNLLDTIATPAAVLAGTFISGIFMPDLLGDGPMRWVLAMIAGGGTAGLVQGASVVARGASTATTAGAGNFVVATTELGGSVATSVLAVLLPVLAAVGVLVLIAFAMRKLLQRRASRADARPLE
ncbi:MAG: DUF4126 domain-containing protein [Xanthomonadales bacterium]|nr:DUF4126 domain-containing protein [Xanthomonadales bacterium]